MSRAGAGLGLDLLTGAVPVNELVGFVCHLYIDSK